MTGAEIKALFANVPDTQDVDLFVTDGNTGGVQLKAIQRQEELGPNAAFLLFLPDGYHLTTT
jgi:hypothetical protein